MGVNIPIHYSVCRVIIGLIDVAEEHCAINFQPTYSALNSAVRYGGYPGEKGSGYAPDINVPPDNCPDTQNFIHQVPSNIRLGNVIASVPVCDDVRVNPQVIARSYSVIKFA